jgi:hypothetical protein
VFRDVTLCSLATRPATFNHPQTADLRNCACQPRRAQSRDQPDTGSKSTATLLSRCQNLQDNEQMVRSIDPRRGTLRCSQWLSMRPPYCLELSSRKPSWPAFRRERANRPDIWTQAIYQITAKHLARRGPSTYGSRPTTEDVLPRLRKIELLQLAAQLAEHRPKALSPDFS